MGARDGDPTGESEERNGSGEEKKEDTAPPASSSSQGSESGDGKDDGGSRLHLKSDEDWKEAARREKEKLDEQAQSAAQRELPPASFGTLLSDLSFQAMLALGLLGPPDSKERVVDLQAARYTIDTLGVLEEKTKGNLTPEEKEYLTQILQNLRLRFVEVLRLAGQQGQKPPEESTGEGKKIIVD